MQESDGDQNEEKMIQHERRREDVDVVEEQWTLVWKTKYKNDQLLQRKVQKTSSCIESIFTV